MYKAQFRVATLKYSFYKIELPSDTAENPQENICDTATF